MYWIIKKLWIVTFTQPYYVSCKLIKNYLSSHSLVIAVGVINYQRRSSLLPMEFPNMLEMFLMYPLVS